RFASIAVHDRVLPEDSAESDGFVAVDSHDEPSGLAPQALRLVLVADRLLDPVTTQHQKVAHHLVALLVHPTRQQHRTWIVSREKGESLVERFGQFALVAQDLAVERSAEKAGRGGQLVDRRQVRAQKAVIHRAGYVLFFLRAASSDNRGSCRITAARP